ncbi:MAG: ABC transporter permease subunit [Gemmataceae bacterium]
MAQNPLKWGADAEGGAPYIFANPERPDQFIGYEVDIVRALERELQRKIEFTQRSFENLVKDVQQGTIDFAMNGLEITDDRLEKVFFTKPYYAFKLQLAVHQEETELKSLADFKRRGLQIGTLGNTAASRLLKRLEVPAKIYEDQRAPYIDCVKGEEAAGLDRPAGVLLDLPIAEYYAKKSPITVKAPPVKFVGELTGRGYYGIAVSKKNPELKQDLDDAITKLFATGELRRIYQKWRMWNDNQEEFMPRNVFLEQDSSVQQVATFGGIRLQEVLWLLLQGAWITIQVTSLGFLVAVVWGLVIALVRLYAPKPLSWLATAYIEFFRGIPVLLLLVFLYYGLPEIGMANGFGDLFKFPAFWVAVVGFGLNYAAYEAEIYRAGITSVPSGQWEAANSLGMSDSLTFRRIILPQAVRVILPPMTNDLVAMFKDTSLVSVIAVTELTKQYLILTRSSNEHLTEIALATAGLYLLMSVPLGLLSRHLEKRWGTAT